jgi:hypothetical protein
MMIHRRRFPRCVRVDDGQALCRLEEVERLLLQCGLVVLPYPDPRVPLSGEATQGRETLIDADTAAADARGDHRPRRILTIVQARPRRRRAVPMIPISTNPAQAADGTGVPGAPCGTGSSKI